MFAPFDLGLQHLLLERRPPILVLVITKRLVWCAQNILEVPSLVTDAWNVTMELSGVLRA